MTVGDYTSLEATETNFAKAKEATGIEAWFAEGMRPTANSAMWAVHDAPLASGHFPVVIYAPSFTSVSWENADLCEYIASYGYVVIASPGMGVGHESTHDVAGVNAQARDISFLIGYAESLPDTDMSKVGVVGFSWGGLSNIVAAAQDNRIDALVALDGSLRYFPGVVKQAGVNPEQMTIPLLFFKGATSLEGQAQLDDRFKSQGANVLNAWTHGDLISVEMLGLIHPEFSSMAQRNEKFWKYEFAGLEQADYGREDGGIGYGWVARYTQEFLDAYLKRDAQALKYLHNSPAENAVPKHTVAVNFRTAQKLPASLDWYRLEVGSKGFDHAAEIYSATQKQQPDFKLDAGAVTSWAYDLLAEGHLSEAVDIMKLAAQLDPSSRAYSSLGEMYTKAGDNRAAIESYKKALTKDLGNILATQGLEERGSSSPTRN
jgi:dienelactone hydrolase